MSGQTKECIEIHSLEELKKNLLWKRMTMRYLP